MQDLSRAPQQSVQELIRPPACVIGFRKLVLVAIHAKSVEANYQQNVISLQT